MSFKRSDMLYNDYSWSHIAGDDPRVSGPPDNTMLNRKEGYEVVYFINKCAEKWQWKENVQACRKLEKAIRLHVPNNVRTQRAIIDWIEINFKGFWDKL